MDVEVCIESVAEAKLAAQFGAKRVELCSALDLGGLTPSVGLIQQCSEIHQNVWPLKIGLIEKYQPHPADCIPQIDMVGGLRN